MRFAWTILLLSGMALGQTADTAKPENSAPNSPPATLATNPAPAHDPNAITIPAGTRIPLSLKQAISTKNAHVERAGHGKGRAEILMHFTSIIYPTGYTVMLPGSVENTPGADNKSVKDSEGTIQQDSDTGKKVEDAAKNGVYGTLGGATAGGLATGGLNGARVGAGVGAAAGVAWALLKRGPDVKLDVGTSIEMEIQRPITVDATRIAMAKATP